ncbi:MAG: NAD(P)/FAD-dependent oxidoreductase [Candidatus Flexifilum sp.]
MERTLHYDAIVVGGRPSGSTLAARLAQGGLRVLLIERAPMPSLPSASMPIIYASTMRLLDEIGAREDEYAAGTPRIKRMITHSTAAQGALPIPLAHGRDYAYAVDRARFDGALWETARRSGVDVRDRTSFLDLIWQGEGAERRASGAVIQSGGERLLVHADLVIGADGRFSAVARKAGAAEYDIHDQNPTTLLYAYWADVAPYDDQGPAAVAYGEGKGYGFLVMDSADGTTAVGIEGRSALLETGPGGAEEFYLSMLRAQPALWPRLEGARRLTDVRGMKKVGNLYRTPGGPGWALVGDAYHQKDPLDGQGIYDAVYTAKLLAEAILAWKRGHGTWEHNLAAYEQAARAETYPMYQATLERVRASLYVDMPAWALQLAGRTLTRWVLEDRLCQEEIGKLFTRQERPDRVMSPPIVLGALLRGPLRDFKAALEREIAR